jgi:hypothetical protein
MLTSHDRQMAEYRAMREAAVKVVGDLLARLITACQKNPWLKVGGADFEPEGFCCEHDHPYCLERYDDIDMLERFFAHGNWGIRTAVQHHELIFVISPTAACETSSAVEVTTPSGIDRGERASAPERSSRRRWRFPAPRCPRLRHPSTECHCRTRGRQPARARISRVSGHRAGREPPRAQSGRSRNRRCRRRRSGRFRA